MRFEKSITLHDMEGGEHEWRITLLEAEQGIDLGFEIWEIAGQALGGILGSAQTIRGQAVLDGASLGQALSSVATQVLRRGGNKFIAKMLRGAKRDGKTLLLPGDPTPKDPDKLAASVVFKHVFRGNYGELLALTGEVLKLNFSSFFASSGANGQSLGDVFRNISKLFTDAPELGDGDGSGRCGTEEVDELPT